MKLTLNGKSEEIPDNLSVLGLLKLKQLNPDFVAIQHNGGILQKDNLADKVLQESDNVEILHFMGGGQN